MADLNDLAQKLAFYQAGGKDPGADNLDKLNAGVGIVDKAITDVLAIKKTQVENRKADAEANKAQAEADKLKGTPSVAYMKPPVPVVSSGGTAGVSGLMSPTSTPSEPQYDYGKMTFEDQDNLAKAELQRAQAEYYKSGQKGGKKLYVNVDTRKLSDTPLPGYVEVSANTGATIASGPAKEVPLQKERDQRRIEREDKLIIDYGTQLDNDLTLRTLKTQDLGVETVGQLSNLVRSGNTVAAAALGIKQAKGLGEVGVLTESDVNRYMTSGMLSQKAADTLSKWLTGTPTNTTIDEIGQINNVIADTYEKKIQSIYNTKVNRLARNLGIPPDEAAHRLDVPYTGGSAHQTTTPPPSKVAGTGLLQDLINRNK